MRFLIDEDVDVRLIGVLRRLGHEARRVPSGTRNGAVMRLAYAEVSEAALAGKLFILDETGYSDFASP